VAGKFLPKFKESFDKTHEEKNRNYLYDIYELIDANYYGDNDDENDILEKVEHPVEEEIRDRALREW
jgi:nucleoside-specific outer membrane channel protein Tsx